MGPDDLRAEVLRHVEQHIGPAQELPLPDTASDGLAVRIHVVPPGPERDWLTLFTTGMSEKIMEVPPGGEAFRYAELLLRLPADWSLTEKALKEPNHSWPIEWLRRIAHYPHDTGSWLGGALAMISNDEPPVPVAPGAPFTCFLLLVERPDFGQLCCSDGRLIHFYAVYPLYTEERDLELAGGVVPLLELFQKHGVSRVIDVRRPNVALLE